MAGSGSRRWPVVATIAVLAGLAAGATAVALVGSAQRRQDTASRIMPVPRRRPRLGATSHLPDPGAAASWPPSPTTSDEGGRMRLAEPRIPPIADDKSLGAEAREVLARASLGPAVNIFRTLAHHPKLFKRWLVFANHVLFKSSLPPRERELLI